jgi:hypothetical protein
MKKGDYLRITNFRSADQTHPLWAVVRVNGGDTENTLIDIVAGPEMFPLGQEYGRDLQSSVPQTNWVLGSTTKYEIFQEELVPDDVWAQIAKRALLS